MNKEELLCMSDKDLLENMREKAVGDKEMLLYLDAVEEKFKQMSWYIGSLQEEVERTNEAWHRAVT